MCSVSRPRLRPAPGHAVVGAHTAPRIVSPEASPAVETLAPDRTPSDEEAWVKHPMPLILLHSIFLWTVCRPPLGCGDLK